MQNFGGGLSFACVRDDPKAIPLPQTGCHGRFGGCSVGAEGRLNTPMCGVGGVPASPTSPPPKNPQLEQTLRLETGEREAAESRSLAQHNIELRRLLEEEQAAYKRKLQAYQEGQQRQAQLVQKLQAKVNPSPGTRGHFGDPLCGVTHPVLCAQVLQYKKKCGEVEQQLLEKATELEQERLTVSTCFWGVPCANHNPNWGADDQAALPAEPAGCERLTARGGEQQRAGERPDPAGRRTAEVSRGSRGSCGTPCWLMLHV